MLFYLGCGVGSSSRQGFYKHCRPWTYAVEINTEINNWVYKSAAFFCAHSIYSLQ